MDKANARFWGAVKALLIVVSCLPQAAWATSTTSERDIISRVQQYWNSITTLEGRFQQIVDGKQGLSGDIFLQKPGKIRLKYYPPSELLVVADGDTAALYDAALDQLSYLDQKRLPLNFLLRAPLSFESASLTPTVHERPNYYEISVTNSEWSIKSPLTLVFSKEPLQLQYWSFVDAAGKAIQVMLVPTRINDPIDPKQFVFRNPRYVR